MSDVIETAFPAYALLPKRETGVYQFLQKFPDYDGRGTVIAIFDSGVDPGADGLQITTEGKPKLIERFDCTGAGDVNTSTVVKADKGEITGLTGRKLKIPITWKNPSGEFHIGVKNAFELYPVKLRERIEKNRKEKLWDPFHKQALADVARFNSEYDDRNVENNLKAKLEKEDNDAKTEFLNNCEKKYKDVGPAYDCVVFHDGSCWRACIDTSENGDLENSLNLGEYSITHEFGPLTKDDQLNCSINVYNEGNCLEIVSVCSPHGTHVASIAAANFPDKPEENGVAPGAQLVSLTIGDLRLGSMETGTALVRAMIRIMQRYKTSPVHVINMSYGEHANWSNSGRIGALMAEVVSRYNVTWVSSAGNHGPALCTVSTPPDISTDSIIGVGAYVSPDMMVAEYSLREKLPGMPFTWTSRGPTIDGGSGVSVCAPGGAITSVSMFTLRCSQLLNGTSMAAPHVAGAVSLLISGLIQKGLPYSSHQIKRTLENTAQFLVNGDHYAQGFGLLCVERAFEHLCSFHNCVERDIRFAVQCGVNSSKGIHVRCSNAEPPIPKEVLVTVEPVFREEAEPKEKIDFNLRLTLVCNKTWISVPSFIDLTNISRSFNVKLDIAALSEGVHAASVDAYDTLCVEKGPVFRVPITVIKPTICNDFSISFSNIAFKPNTIKRHFLLVPDLATWAILKLRTPEKDRIGKFFVHCVQLRKHFSCKKLEYQKYLTINSCDEVSIGFQCMGGLILEVVVAKYWANLGDIIIDYDIEFHGIKPDSRNFVMQGSDGIFQIECTCGPRVEEVSPNISLQNAVLVVRPTESKISPCCKERDIIPPGRQIYENVLTYNIHFGKNYEILPSFSLLCDFLYESEFESQLWMLFDSNKQYIASGDAYPSKYLVKVDKGDYVLKLLLRHEKRDVLEKLSDTPFLISQKLTSAVSMDVYLNQSQAMLQGKKMGGAIVPPQRLIPIYVAPLNNEKLTKNLPSFQYLQGTITFAKDEMGKKVDTYPFKYVPPESIKKPSRKENNKDKEKSKQEECEESLRDLKVQWLSKFDDKLKANEFYESLKADYPEYVYVHLSYLQSMDPWDPKKFGVLPFFEKPNQDVKELLSINKTVLSVANVIISCIDLSNLLSYFGIKSDLRADASKTKVAMERDKNAIVEALCRKGCALCRICFLEDGDKDELLKEMDDLWQTIMKLTDLSDSKILYFALWHASINSHYGRLVRFVQKLLEEKSVKDIDTFAADVYSRAGWSYLEKHMKLSVPVRYPSQYRLF